MFALNSDSIFRSFANFSFLSKKNNNKVCKQESGAKYDGQYENDLKNGQGKYTYGNGDVYKGQWKDGKRHGQGTYTYKESGGA